MNKIVTIPDRENLETMSRTDIQKLCKHNNIKANMRTDEMISALCEVANGKDAPRTRAASLALTASRLPSRNAVLPKITESSLTKKALQPSESNTDAESEAPVSAPTTRRKAKEIQMHLGKGRPVIAGGSGARNITKPVSRGAGRRTKASAMLHQDPIPEEDENAPVEQSVGNGVTNKVPRPSSVRPQSQTHSVPSGSHDPQPSQLPTPAPSQPSYSLSTVQISALDARVTELESFNLATRICQIEGSMVQIPALQAEVRRLESANIAIKDEMAQFAKAHAQLKVRALGLETEGAALVDNNGTLKERVSELEAKLRDRDVSTGSVIVHSLREDKSGECVEDAPRRIAISTADSLPNPSPSQPTLGKRNRSETPDCVDGPQGGAQEPYLDAELQAIHRVTRPRKKARLDANVDDDSRGVFQVDRGGPSSTSTPRQQRSDSPPAFFSVGRRAPTPLVRQHDVDAYLHLDSHGPGLDDDIVSETNAVAGPSRSKPASTADGGPQTPPSRGLLPADPGATTDVERAGPREATVNVNDPGFFGDPLPVFYTQGGQLPYPLNPATPTNPPDILEQSGQYATPKLGEPWKYNEPSGYVNPSNISQLAENVGLRVPASTTDGGLDNPYASSSTAAGAEPASSGNYTFRAGGRRERNDKYNPYFTPQRGPGTRHRTGLTPARGFSMSLKSPARMADVAESAEDENEDGVERSPPQLRTLYGTELEGDTRFGDYGANLGKFDWGKFLDR